jgi:hypothetical protein
MSPTPKVLIILAALCVAACASPGATPAAGQKTLYVGPELVDCTGVAPQQCLQVKERPEDPYTLLYQPIEGFAFEPGYEYELLVREEAVANPPADASSRRLILVEVVSKTPVASTTPATTGAAAGTAVAGIERPVIPSGQADSAG